MGIPATQRLGPLDGLRGVALLAVLVYHGSPASLRGGFFGVEMFFVLSGFLLTWLLLDEHRRTGAIDRLGYAARRIRRIFPGLVVLLSVLAIAGRFIAPEDADRLAGDIVGSIAGVTNWQLITEGSSYFAHVGRPPLVRHLWSIAVELQAYIVLPFVAAFIARCPRRVAMTALSAGIWGSATLMALLYASPDPYRAYYGTDTRIGALLTGALVATFVTHSRRTGAGSISSRGVTVLGTVAAVVLLVSFAFVDERGGFLYPAGFLIVQAATAGTILLALRPGALARSLDSRVLRWFGARSYGIYLWHWPLVVLAGGTDHPRPVEVIATAGAAILLGDLSYRFVERPAMTRTGWAARPLPRATRLAAPAWVAAATVLVVMAANTVTVDPIEESLLAGERALAEQEAEVDAFDAELEQQRIVAGTNAAAGTSPTKKGKVPTAAGPKKGTVKLAAVGDSVMLGAAGQIKSRFGKAGYVDAVKNRRFGEGVEVIKKLRKKKRLGPVVIVHLGNNGVAKRKDIDALMKQTKGVDHVLLVTVRVNRGWQDGNNEVIKDAEKRYDKIVVVNWYRTSKGHDDWFYSDGTHMNPKGAAAYTKLLAASIPPEKDETEQTPKPTPAPTPTPGLLDPIIGPP